ncbi:MAG TPA: flagellar FliJ family protein [Phycisphaerales bacterium]|nr:flagellar FliJ family protein [Phycisphaerales bacterium]
MAKFRFTLQALLRAREVAEKNKQRVVAGIEAERLALEGEIRRLQEGIRSGKGQMRQQLVGDLDIDALRQNATGTMQKLRRAQRAVLELAGVHQRLEGARADLVEAAKQRRAVELLRDRRFAEWKAGLEKREAAALDDLAARGAEEIGSQRFVQGDLT